MTTKKDNTKEVISEEQIKEWKAEHGNIYKNVMSGGSVSVIWRKLKRQEYLALMGENYEDLTADEKFYKRQEDMVATVSLFPDNIAEIIEQNAGIATVLSDEILLKSGFDELETTEL